MSIRERFVRYWQTLTNPSLVADQARMAATDRAAARNRREREANPQKLYCPKCQPRRRIDWYSDENDYGCNVHGFINPIREDGAIISGDGQCGLPRVIGHE